MLITAFLSLASFVFANCAICCNAADRFKEMEDLKRHEHYRKNTDKQ